MLPAQRVPLLDDVNDTLISKIWYRNLQDAIANIASFWTVVVATGDGVTDVTNAVQNALNGAGVVIFPAGGNYVISTVNVPANTTVRMDGATITQAVLPNLNGSPIFNVTGDYTEFIGGTINGQKSLQPANGFSDSFNTGANGTGRAFRAAIKADALATPGIANISVRNIRFTNTYGACVATQDVTNVTVNDCVTDTCYFEVAFPYNSGAGQLGDLTLMRNIIRNCGTGDPTVNSDGMTAKNYRRVTCLGNKGFTIERCLIKVESGRSVNIADNIMDTNTIDNFAAIQVDCTSTVLDLNITGNNFYNVGKGVFVTNGTCEILNLVGNVTHTTTGSATADAVNITSITTRELTISGNSAYNVKRHGYNIQGIHYSLSITGGTMAGQSANGSYGIILDVTTVNWEIASIKGVTIKNFEQSAAGSGTCNFSNSGGSLITNFEFQNNHIFSGAVGNRAVRTAGVDLFINGQITDNFIEGQLELYSAGPAYRDNRVTGTITLPAGTANIETTGVITGAVGASTGTGMEIIVNGTSRKLDIRV